jgi:lysyl-tRNA synthetase, class II
MRKMFFFFKLNRFFSSENAFIEVTDRIRLGDIIGVTGTPLRTKKNELSIRPKNIIILTPCLRQIPHVHYGLKDKV